MQPDGGGDDNDDDDDAFFPRGFRARDRVRHPDAERNRELRLLQRRQGQTMSREQYAAQRRAAPQRRDHAQPARYNVRRMLPHEFDAALQERDRLRPDAEDKARELREAVRQLEYDRQKAAHEQRLRDRDEQQQEAARRREAAERAQPLRRGTRLYMQDLTHPDDDGDGDGDGDGDDTFRFNMSEWPGQTLQFDESDGSEDEWLDRADGSPAAPAVPAARSDARRRPRGRQAGTPSASSASSASQPDRVQQPNSWYTLESSRFVTYYGVLWREETKVRWGSQRRIKEFFVEDGSAKGRKARSEAEAKRVSLQLTSS